MVKKESQLKAGDKVFIINGDFEIEEKIVHGVTFEEKEVKYQLEEHQCGGTERTEIFKTKAQAEKQKQDFLDKLKFKVGDLVVFECEEYRRKIKKIGRIDKIQYLDKPYVIKGAYREFDNASDVNILLKVKNEFIENYGNLQELYEQFKEKELELREVIKLIYEEHERLEKELNMSIRKQYSIWHFDKSKPLFADRFSYERDDGY